MINSSSTSITNKKTSTNGGSGGGSFLPACTNKNQTAVKVMSMT